MNAFLKTIFPFLSTAASMVGGPIGTAAANALGKSLGADKENPTMDDLAASYAKATPEQIAAAKKEEHDFAVKMQEMGFKNVEELERIAAADRASARDREVKLKDRIPAILAVAITCGFFGLLFCMLKWSPPASNKDLLNIMLGSLGSAWIAVVGYYFGSSAGSARKDEILASK